MEKLGERIPRLAYAGYGFLFHAKKLLGMRANRHRNFLIWRLIRLIDAGCVDVSKIGICSVGKTDGAGAQALAKISAMCFAQAYGMRYVHAPFQNLAHAEEPVMEWDRKWEELLRLGAGVELLNRSGMKTVGIGEYLDDRYLWDKEVVLCERHYHSFIELAPEYGTVVSERLKTVFQGTRKAASHDSVCSIGVHVRRGDVGNKNEQTRHRFQPTGEIVDFARQVIEGVCRAGYVPDLHIYSNGSMEELKEFRCFERVNFHVGTSALDTFEQLATSDVLMCTRSDFSLLAGVYCAGVVVCDERHRTPLPDWVRTQRGKTNLAEQVFERLNNRAADFRLAANLNQEQKNQ